MTETTPHLPGLSPVDGKALTARFDGGALSSDAGLLALREVERRLDVAGRLAACVDDPRDPARTQHSVADVLRFRMLMIAAGYEDGIDANALRADRCSRWRWSGCRGLRCLGERRMAGTASRSNSSPRHDLCGELARGRARARGVARLARRGTAWQGDASSACASASAGFRSTSTTSLATPRMPSA